MFSRLLGCKKKNSSGTLEYMAPEILSEETQLDAFVDIWTLGVVAFEFSAGFSPFSHHMVLSPTHEATCVREAHEELARHPSVLDRYPNRDPQQFLSEQTGTRYQAMQQEELRHATKNLNYRFPPRIEEYRGGAELFKTFVKAFLQVRD